MVELKESEVSERWKERYGQEVKTVLGNLFEVDDWIINHVANSPGVADEFLISNIVEYELSKKYDYVVWDTAASSSTMHLILLQKEFYEHLGTDVKIYLKLRDALHTDKIIDLLEQWRSLAQRVWNEILKAKFFIVTTTDELSLIQSAEITKDLHSLGIEIRGKICNRVSGETSEEFVMKVPEKEGSAREIVDSVVAEVLKNMEAVNAFRKSTLIGKNIR